MTMSDQRSTLVLSAMAVVFFFVLLLPSLSPHYGFYSDELYYLACADRLDMGYVDHPPLFVFMLRLQREIFGDSLFALRMLPAAAGAVCAFLAGWMARRMGGGSYAQILATLAVMVSPVSLLMFSFFTVNCSAILLWTTTSWILLELCRSRQPRLWLVLGCVLGLAFLNKHTAVVPIAGVAIATALSPLRRDLAGPWPWIGALLAALIVSPNLYWQVTNDWPSLAFYAGVEDSRYTASVLEQITVQIMAQNPASFVIWAGGIFFFLRSPGGLRFRALGWLVLVGLAAAILGGSKLPYRVAGVFPLAFAGGAVWLEAALQTDAKWLGRTLFGYALPAIMLAIGLFVATFALPILPPDTLEHHPLYDASEGGDFRPEIGTNRIPYHLGNRTHWRAFVERVEQVYADLDREQEGDVIILADYFGHAGALEHYARERLPPVYSPMTGYFLWGPPEDEPRIVISIGIDEAFLLANFEHVRVADTFRCRFCPPVVNDLPIYLAHSPRRRFLDLWPEIGELDDRRTRLLRAQQARSTPSP